MRLDEVFYESLDIDMSELQQYLELVTRCLSENRKLNSGVLYQKHHIFPRSLYPALKHKKWNIVLFTPTEHKLAHYLLCKITIGRCNETMNRSYSQYFNW